MKLSDFETLAAAHAHTETRELNKKDLLTHDVSYEVEEVMDAILAQSGTGATIRKQKKAAKLFNKILNGALDSVDVFGLPVTAALNRLIANGLYTQAMRNSLELQAKTLPFENVTQEEFNSAKGLYSEKEVLNYTQGKNIKITLIDSLPENCVATTWTKETDFDFENNGKIAHLKTGLSLFKLRMDNKKVEGELLVRIPLKDFDFTVEVI